MVRRTGESGNIFFTLFGAVAMVGLIGVATSALLRGPVGTVVAINQKSKADSQIQIASKLALIEAAQQADGGDCDGDQVVEPLPWRDPGGGSAPTNAGWMPMSIGAAKVDPWGTDYGYCVWDMGVVDNDPACDNVDGVNSNSRRLSGGSRTDYPVLAIVSAGPDRTFQVGCNDWADNVPSNVNPSVATSIIYNPQPNDDIVVAFTYDEAISASQGLWALKSNDPDTLETGRGIEVGGRASFQSSASFGGFADFGGGGRLDLMADNSLFLLPTDTSVGSTDTDCNGGNQGALRRNTDTGNEILEICEGGVWVEVGTNATGAVAEINDLDDGQTGGGNVFLGTDDGSMSFDSAQALSNTGLGASALDGLTSGDSNTAVGNGALGSVTTGGNNTAFGAGAGSTITTGSDNILIGQGVGGGLAAGTSGYVSVGDIFYSSNYGAAASINAGAIGLLGNTDVTGTLDVTGAISGDSLGVTNGITGDFLTVTNTVTGGALSITNNGTIGGNLYVNGGVADIDADLIVTGNLYDDSGNLTINDATDIIGNTDITGTLATSGQATLDSLSVTNNATIGGTLGVTGAATLSSTLNVTDVASFGDKIGVGDAVTGSGTASGTACAVPGEIQYDIENNYLMVCTGGSWEVIGTSGGGGSGIGGWWDQVLLGVDERIYYIDGFVGVGTNDPKDSLHVSSGGLLVATPHTGTASVPVTGAGTRMMFHTQMSAFRAGAVTGTDWDDANIGAYSMAMGRDVRAAATDSLAFGRDVAVTNTGTNSMGVGLGVSGGVSPLVAGAGSLGVFSGDQAGLNFNTANTVGLFGSKVVLDPREAGTVGAGAMEIAADGSLVLDVEGDVGAKNFCDENGANCFTALSVSSGVAPGNDREILYNSGGVMGTDPNFVFASTGYLGIGTSTPQADVDIARTGSILMPRGTTGQRPSSAVNGMFRYNADNDRFEGRQGGQWRDVLTDSALAAGNAGEVQFNSGGELGASTSFFWDTAKGALALASSTVSGTLTLDVTGDVGAVNYCDDAGNDCFTAADVTSGSLGAPGNDREMIFNDGGVLGTDVNFVFTSAGALGLGTNTPGSTLDVVGTLNTSGTATFGDAALLAAGLGTAPSLAFSADTDTGLYSPAADQIGISTNGSEKIRITAAGALVIGDTAASSGTEVLEFDVTGDVGAQNYCDDLGNDCFTANDIVSGSLGAPGADREILYNSNGQLDTDANFVYTSSGRFGVGTGTPQAFADFNSVEAILLPRGTTGQRPSSPVNGMFRYNADNDRFEGRQGGQWRDVLTDSALAAGSDRQLQFNSGGELGAMTTLVFTSTGLLGVGTATPAQTVDVGGTLNATGAVTFGDTLGVTGAGTFAEDVRLKDGLETDPALTFTNDQNTGLFSAAADELGFTVAGSEAMRLDASGNLLLGTTSVSGTLLADVEGNLGAIQYCDENGANCFTAASVSSGASPAPGSPTEVVYNSGGVLWADTNFVYTAAGDLIIGSYQLDDTTTGTEDYRMFFDVSKGAFRAGRAEATQWDDASVGIRSVAMGWNTIASGGDSVAMGRNTTASGLRSTAFGWESQALGDQSFAVGEYVTAGGDYSVAMGGYTQTSGSYSTAMGVNTFASGNYSTAMGNYTSAGGLASVAMGQEAHALADYSFAFGLGDTTGFNTNPALVTGQSSLGIFMGTQDNVDLTAANTMGLFGGSMVIDPAVPATNLSADTALEVEGTVKIAYGGEACDAAREGAVRFSSTGNVFAVCADNLNGWEDIKLGPDTLADLDDTNLTGPATGDILYYSGSEWVNAQLPASSIIAPGSDRQVTFNSGGNFATDASFVYTSAGDFIVGSWQINDDNGSFNDNARMYFDKSTAAFRAGLVGSNKWDTANVGDHSVAMGYETTSSGDASVAIGYQTTASNDGALASGYQSLASGITSLSHGWSTVASGSYGVALGYNADATGANSTAIGDYAIASGLNAMAFGNVARAGDGTAGSGAGDYSVAFGLGNNSVLNIPQVTGDSSFGVFMGDQSNVDMTASNTMGLFGGSMVIDPATPATNLSADTALEVEGTVKIAYGGEACDAAREGAIRFDSGANTFALCANVANDWEDIKLGPDTLADLDDTNLTGPATGDVLYYSGSEWVNAALPSSSVSAPGSDRQITFNSAGDFAADTNFVYTSAGDFIIGSYQIEDTGTGSEDKRMFFDVSSGAFRAGTTTGAEWNYASAGSNSVAFGYNTVASGLNSFAIGELTTASGWSSAAFGANNTASANQSTVFGYTSDAAGDRSFAAGWSVGALGDQSFAAGQDADAVGVNSFAFGLGNSNNSNLPQVSGNRSFGIFMDVQDGVDLTSANTMGLFGGRMVIDPAAPATVFAPATGGEQNLEFHVEGDIGGVNYCDNAGNDCFTAADVASLASGSVPAPGSDRQVIYNSGGSFDAATNFVYTSAGDFIVGSYQIEDTGTGSEDSRMFFDVSNSAFRAGAANAGQWDYSSMGQYSAAFGRNSIASGSNSFAMGSSAIASADSSIAMGTGATANSVSAGTAIGTSALSGGNFSLALATSDAQATGPFSIAMGRNVIASGSTSMALGLGSFPGTKPEVSGQGSLGIFSASYLFDTPPVISGSNSIGIFLGEHDNYDLTANNRMALVGGDFLIDDTGESGSEGCIRYDGATSKLQFSHDCTSFSDMGAVQGAAGADRQIQFNSGNAFAADANFVYTSAGRVGIGVSNPDKSLHVAGGARFEVDGATKYVALGTPNAVPGITIENAGVNTKFERTASYFVMGNKSPPNALYIFDTTDNVAMGGQSNGNTTQLYVDGTIKMAYGGEACDAAREGAVQFTSSSNTFYFCADSGTGWEAVSLGAGTLAALSDTNISGPATGDVLYYSGSEWVNAALPASSIIAPGSDRQLIFNSAGDFTTDTNFVYTSSGRLGMGTAAPNALFEMVGNGDNPMIILNDNFGGNQDDIGIYNTGSVFKISNYTNANDLLTIDMNTEEMTLSGGLGVLSIAGTSGEVRLVDTNDFSDINDYVTVEAAGDAGFAVQFYDNSLATTFDLMKLTSAGDMALGVASPVTKLDVDGTVKIAYGGEACDAAREGAIRFDSGANTFAFCADDLNGWETVSLGAGSLSALSDTNISGPATGDVLYYSGSEWVNANLAVNDLTDARTAYSSGSMYVGSLAGASATGGSNTVLGYQAGEDLTSGEKNTLIGQGTGRNITTGNNNTFIGENAGFQATSGIHNIFIGTDAGLRVTGSNNVAIGTGAQGGTVGLASTRSVFVGDQVADSDAVASHSVVLGASAAQGATVTDGIIIGYNAGSSQTGSDNIFMGRDTGDNVTGSSNILIGNNLVPPSLGTSNYLNIGGIIYGSGGTVGDIRVAGTGAFKVPDGLDGDRPTNPAPGMIRFNSTSGSFEGHDGSTWGDLGGGLWTDNTTHISYSSLHILNPGETMTTAGFDGGMGNGFVWHPDKQALRVGSGDGTKWDEASIGTKSFVFGANSMASNTYAIAMGRYSNATGSDAIAMGNGNDAGGEGSTAIGRLVEATANYSHARGNRVSVTGVDSWGFGLYDGIADTANPPAVSGQHSYGIFMGDFSQFDFSSSQVFGLFGGEIMIDYSSATAGRGCIRYDEGTSKLQFSHDCATYSDMGSGGAIALGDLSDVDTTGFADGHVLTYSAGASGWVSAANAGGGAFTGLSDTPSTYSAQSGKFVRVNSGETALEFTDQIIDQEAGNAPTGMALDDLSDVNAGAPSTNEVLTWDGSEWIASAVSGTDGGKWSDGLGTDDIIYNSGAAPKVGIGLTTPAVTLDVDGLFKLADSGDACGASLAGSMRYKDNSLWYCNGTSWNTLADGSSVEGAATATLVAHGAETAASTSFALDPTALGASVGDLMVVSAVWEDDAAVTPPAGWTTVYDDSNPSSGITGRLTIHTQKFSGSVPGSQSWSYAGGSGVAYGWSILSGATGVIGVFTHQYPTTGLGTASFNISAGTEGAVVYSLADSFSQPGEAATFDTGVVSATNDATPVNGRAALTGFASTFGTVSYTTTAIDRDSFTNMWLTLGDPANTPDVAAAGIHGAIQLNSGGSLGANNLVYTDTERLGIGTTAPTAPVHITKTGDPTLLIEGGGAKVIEMRDGGQSWRMGNLDGNDFQIESQDAIELRAKVGIEGTGADPANMLGVSGAASIGAAYYSSASPANGLIVEGPTGIGTVDPQTKLDVVGTLRAIDDAAGCTSTVRGAIRYNSAGGAMEVCDGSSWGSLASGGGLWTDNTTHISYSSLHILNPGETMTTAGFDGGSTGIIFHNDKRALRIGSASGTQWDEGNIGTNSLIVGNNATATASGSVAFGAGSDATGTDSFALAGAQATAAGTFAMGFSVEATANGAFAVGDNSTASGGNSISIGHDTIAGGQHSIAMGSEVNVTGNHSMGYGLALGVATDPVVSGDNSFGVFLGDQSGVNLSSANVMAVMGGNLGVGTVTPETALDVYGAIKFSSAGGTACDAAREGAIQYGSGGSKVFEVCADLSNGWEQLALGGTVGGALNDLSDVDTTGYASGEVLTYSAGASGWVSAPVSGAIWSDEGSNIGYSNSLGGARIGAVSGAASPVGATAGLGSGGGSAAGTDRQIQFNNAGSLGADTNFVYTTTGNVGIGTSAPTHDLNIVSTSPEIALADTDSFTDTSDRVLLRAMTNNFLMQWFNGGPNTVTEWLEVGADGMYLRGVNRDFTIETTSSSAGDGPDFFFVRSKSGGLVDDGTEGGEVEFFFEDGSGTPIKTAGIGAQVNGTTGLNNVPTDLEFATGNGASDPAIRMLIDSQGLVSFTSTGAIVLPAGTDGQRPSSAQAGMIRFNSTSGTFEGHDGSTWGSLASGGGSPAAPDRGIQFNSGGSFAADTNFVFTSAGRLGIGTSSPEYAVDIQYNGGAELTDIATLRVANTGSQGSAQIVLREDVSGVPYGFYLRNFSSSDGSENYFALGDLQNGNDYLTIDRNTGVAAFTRGDLSVTTGNNAIFNVASSADGRDATINMFENYDGVGDDDGVSFVYDGGTEELYLNSVNNTVTTRRMTMDRLTGDVTWHGTGALTVHAGTTAQRPSPGQAGMIRFNSTLGSFEGHDGSTWGSLASGGGTPATPDRGIQFNSGGSFAAEANFTYTSAGDFIVGSYQIGDTGTGSEDSRMFFDVSNSAFRAGRATGAEWDAANIGDRSVALGYNTTASAQFSVALGNGADATGVRSVALGNNTVSSAFASTAMGSGADATGNYSTAMGIGTLASGESSTAMGRYTTASGIASTAMGGYTSAGNYAMAIGLTGTNPAIDPVVSGQQSLGIFMGNQSGYDLSDTNTMALIGVANLVLDEDGSTPASKGCLRFNDTTDKLQYSHDCSAYSDFGAGSGTPATPDRGIQFNSGGSFAAEANFTYTADGDFIVGSYQLDDTGTGSEDDRMFFDVSKGAFRAGGASGTQWNAGSVGNYSIAMGDDAIASGLDSIALGSFAEAAQDDAIALGHGAYATNFYSFAAGLWAYSAAQSSIAIGENVVATGYASVAMGDSSEASGSQSVAIGNNTTASGDSAVALGSWTTASAAASTAIGNYTSAGGLTSFAAGQEAYALGDHSFAFGLGNSNNASRPQVTGTSSFGIFMGDQSGVDLTAANTLGLFGGEIMIDYASSGSSGCIRYDEGTSKLQFSHDCTTYSDMGSGSGSSLWTDNTTHISYSSAFILNAGETMTTAGFDGGMGTGLVWYPGKGALRAGSASGVHWNESNVGTKSFAFGNNAGAGGNYAFAAGSGAWAAGEESVAIGFNTDSSGYGAVAIGNSSWSTDTYSVAIGSEARVANGGGRSIAMGNKVKVDGGSYSMALGLGTTAGTWPQVSGDYSFGIFLGDQGGVDLASANTMAVMGGNLGIGTVTPNVELDVVGDIEYTGTITDVSDRRLKTDIKALNEFYGSSVTASVAKQSSSADLKKGNGLLRRSTPRNDGVSATPLLDRLAAVDTYSFRMKDDPDGEIELGVMAQDVKKTFPELVKTAEDNMGTMSVNYVGFIAPLIEASKELHAQNKTLQAENAALRTEIASIQNTQDDILQEIKGIKAHTGYGINKAEIGLWLLAGMGGGMMIMFLMGGALRHRSRQDG